MLCQFSFGNYKAFKNEAVLDFIAEPIKEHKKSLIIDSIDNEKFIPIISIYGPNGGGKSTVLEALNFLRLYILQTIILVKLQDDNDKYGPLIANFSKESSRERYHKFEPECKNQPTHFDIMFRADGTQFKYQLSLLQNKIMEENLYSQTVGEESISLIFERSEKECILGEAVDDIAVERVSNTMPLISHIAINYDVELIDKAIHWFLNIDSINYDDPKKEHYIRIPKSNSEKQKMFEMLCAMDIQIKDIRIEKDLDGNIKNIYMKHLLENGKIYEIPFSEESSGTRKLFSFLANCISCLDKGSLIIADELDAKLHPKLLQFIIELFTNPDSNKKGAQLLITSHDIATMTPKVFRRDEIWLCARNPLGASKLYSLISFRKENGLQPRNDEVYGKRYLAGYYGADPYIQNVLDWSIENEP
ncbi:ATP-binding protein [Lachnospiraceae bacterium]|nr:ATP-binding protein [Lachnospiraceae bacterium]